MEKALYTLNTLRIEHICDYDDLTAKIKPNTFRSVELSLRHHRCTPTLLEADFPPLCIQSFEYRITKVALESRRDANISYCGSGDIHGGNPTEEGHFSR
jgi:hypothetical protein